jgi:hypothetical protein
LVEVKITVSIHRDAMISARMCGRGASGAYDTSQRLLPPHE